MPVTMNLVTWLMGNSQIKHFSMVLWNQTETLFQYRINCVIGRCRGISKPRDLYIFWSFWNLAYRSANFRAVWYLKTQSHDFKCHEGELSYAVIYVWMLNVSMNINWSKLWLHVIYCNISHAIDTQFKIKNEKAILDSVTDRLNFN